MYIALGVSWHVIAYGKSDGKTVIISVLLETPSFGLSFDVANTCQWDLFAVS